ncbi:MAG: hypothetical protein ACT4OS_08635 [Acidimicrobiales bacterium]
MRKRFAALGVILLVSGVLGACGNGGDTAGPVEAPPAGAPGDDAEGVTPTPIEIVANDFGFVVPATFSGGLVEFSYSNVGKEPHFAAFARPTAGKTIADVKAALTGPSTGGPPPYEDVLGLATANAGATTKMVVNLPAGDYVLYCALPTPDGVPHTAKGMIVDVKVTDGPEGDLPAGGMVKAVDFGFADVPTLVAGPNVVGISNEGKQIHEVNLIELSEGSDVDDAVAWLANEGGPPPMTFLTGPAVAPGLSATGEFDLEAGKRYAFICAIPDFLGDFKPHATKGMFTSSFTVG